MLGFISFLIVVVSISVFVAGTLALIRDSKKLQNRWFFIFTSFLFVWIIANFVDSNFPNYHYVNFFLKIDFIIALFIAWSLMRFSSVLPPTNTKKNGDNYQRTLLFSTLIMNIVMGVLIFSNLVITSQHQGSQLIVSYSNLFNIYVLLIITYFLYSLIILFLKRRVAKGKERNAVNLIFAGLLLAVIANVLTNLVFPIFISNNSVVKQLNIIGYVGLFVFTLFIYLAITTQKLFDIRLVIARSLGYIFALSIVVLVFVAPTIIFTNYLVHETLRNTTLIYLIIVMGIVVIVFQPLRNKFNKLSNRIFLRDYYDIQDILDKLGNLLVGSVDTDEIEKHSAKIISDAIKPTFIEYLLVSTKNLSSARLKLREDLGVHKNNIIVLDDLDVSKDASLFDALTNSGIAVAVRLRTKDEYLGFMILGYKRSGLIYSDTDKRLLTIAADEIAISLQNALHFEEIQRFNLTLQDKVDEATLKLRRANDKLRALDETKDDFISMASHQLRTPLTSVKGYLSMVLEGDVGNITKAQKDMLNQAFFSSQRMVYIIADLLNVSRLKTGKFIIERNPINLSHVIQQELAQVEEIASAKNIKIIYDKPTDFPVLLLDETKTRQAIMNFVDNAIYYTPTGGEIKIILNDNPQTIELKVVDNGIGVPKTEQHHLFTKFYRAGNARKARPDGTGLGLFMAKKVILAEGGSIIFDSQENKGSTFGFIFTKSKIKPSGKEPVKESSETKELAEV